MAQETQEAKEGRVLDIESLSDSDRSIGVANDMAGCDGSGGSNEANKDGGPSRLMGLSPDGKVTGMGFVVLALGLHLLILLLAQQYWRLPERQVAAAKTPKIQAYLLYSSLSNSQTEGIESPVTRTVEAQAVENQPLAETQLVEPQAVKTVPVKTLPVKAQSAEIEPVAVEQQAPEPAPLPHEPLIFSPPETDARLLVPEAIFTPKPHTDAVAQALFSRDASTLSYLQRQRRQQLDALVRQEADEFTAKRSMSEMDGELEVLLVPNADDFSQATTLGNKLDPNRIVRKGDTCYRVVKVGNQLNPYAENLGYPFDCSGKKMNQDIQDAIDVRWEQMHVRQHN